MDGEQRFWAVFWFCIASVAISLIWSIAWYCREQDRFMTEHGYIQVQKSGSCETYWTKPTTRTAP